MQCRVMIDQNETKDGPRGTPNEEDKHLMSALSRLQDEVGQDL